MCIELNEWEGGEYGRSWWKLDSIAYGCPDANIEWYRQVLRFFVDRCGFTRSLFFPCLFILHLEARRQILVGVATDNFEMFFSNDPKTRQTIKDLRRAMDSEWPMTHADGPDETLGIKEEQTQNGGKLCTQPSMLKKIQEHFFPDGRVPLTLTPEMKGYDEPLSHPSPLANVKAYQSGNGMLAYMGNTRFDFLVTRSKMAANQLAPTERDMQQLSHCAAFLLSSHDVGLRFGPGDAATRGILDRCMVQNGCRMQEDRSDSTLAASSATPSTLDLTALFPLPTSLLPSLPNPA